MEQPPHNLSQNQAEREHVPSLISFGSSSKASMAITPDGIVLNPRDTFIQELDNVKVKDLVESTDPKRMSKISVIGSEETKRTGNKKFLPKRFAVVHDPPQVILEYMIVFGSSGDPSTPTKRSVAKYTL